ncbi:DarT1-associated NADAR antitoxin family protein [Oceanobacillus kimchii]|uniref:DarT1-associated NADAR antitoxin family protein n=1 Tax=Oceanobacillus kimchii TaxID=746691 RepID=UPI003B02DFAF
MAKRPVFIADQCKKSFVKEKEILFEWFPGFSITQKQKSITSLHENAKKYDEKLKLLEISSKSIDDLGVALSAFNLIITAKNGKKFSVETAFQASKVFQNGGPYIDLYEKTSKEAKKDQRIKNSGNLFHFQFFSRKWELEPKTLFYDWLYINALALNGDLAKKVIEYNAFTDIEFNPKKSINCQAKAVALYVSLYKANLLDDALDSVDNYKNIIIGTVNDQKKSKKTVMESPEQLSIFDEIE